MAFVNTLVSLNNMIDTPTQINNRLASTTEKVSILTPSNNAVTIDPGTASLFKITCSSNTTVTLSNVNAVYTNNGGTVSILLTRSADSVTITWPNSIVWKDGSAPDLEYQDMIILTTFDSGTTWYGSSVTVNATFPSA